MTSRAYSNLEEITIPCLSDLISICNNEGDMTGVWEINLGWYGLGRKRKEKLAQHGSERPEWLLC